MALPLEDIKVLDLSRLLPGGFCSQILADFGAEVIKVEDTEAGDYIRWMPPMIGEQSALFYALNRNKKSIRLNLKKEEGREVFLRLVDTADVLLEGFRPGVMEKLGLGYQELAQRNPRLIYCALTGYGYSGPYRDIAGHDINYLNYAGISSMIGHRNERPALCGVQIADIGGGALWAVIAILLALQARQVTGRGQFCDVAMLDGAFSWLVLALASYSVTGQIPIRGREILGGGFACYNIYPTSDGKFVSIGAIENKFWAEFCRKLGKEEYIPFQFVPDRQDEMIAEFYRIFRQKTRDEWVEFFSDSDICFSPVLELNEAVEHPQIRERQMLARVQKEEKEILLAGVPVKLSDTPGTIKLEFAGYGENTERILKTLGYTLEDIQAMRERGVI